MTLEEALAAHGPVVAPESLGAEKARRIAVAIREIAELEVTFVEARQRDGTSALVVDVEASIGQKPRNEIRSPERLLVVFDASDRAWPAVYALRDGFPTTAPHLNVAAPGLPPSLCLSVQPYAEVQRDWSPAYYVRLMRHWLEATARGDLHRPDQPVEPFLLEAAGTLIVPHDLVQEPANSSDRWVARHIADNLYRVVRDNEDALPRADLLFASQIAPPREHAIATAPQSIAALAALVDGDGFDLVRSIKEHVRAWQAARAWEAIPMLLLQVPVTRSVGGPVERYDVRAFKLASNVVELGDRLGIIDPKIPSGALIGAEGNDGSAAALDVFNVHATMSRETAAIFNGESQARLSYVAIGAGALGSQLLMNLTRGGAPPSDVLDKDRLLPHNVARHLLLSDALGALKAEAVAHTLSSVLDGAPPVRSWVADVLTSAADAVLSDAQLILDISASVAVARRLAIDVLGSARRISLFLNPAGSDLVLLAEDVSRTARLDHLEVQYYWSVANEAVFKEHLKADDGIRYGEGCRDISGRGRQTTLAVHAGNGAAAFRRAASDRVASAFVWQLDELTGTVARAQLDTRPMRAVSVAQWTVLMSTALLDEVARRRAGKLPNETGGVLIGALDMQRQIAYLVGSVPAPPDSREWPTGYIRGSFGLRKAVTELCARVGGNLQYVGEWHSHPDGATTQPSEDDAIAYAWLAEALIAEGRPPIMLIVGAHDVRCIIHPAQGALALVA